MDENNFKFHNGAAVLVPSSPESEEFPLSMEMDGSARTLEKDPSGASSECQQDGAGEPGNLDLMTKMMIIAGNHCFPANGGVSNGALPSGNDGLPSKMSEISFPAMISLMSGNGMAAMTGKKGFEMGQIGVAKLFDCIIDMSLARVDLEGNDADTSVEIPCQYCSRSFSCQMSLKTHILVAHDTEDTSVLNIGEFVTGAKGRQNSRNGGRQRHSQDADISAAQAVGNGLETSDVKLDFAGDIFAAETGRGMKRGRMNDLETTNHGGAADDVASYHDHLCSLGHHEAMSGTTGMQQALGNRKRKVYLPSQQSFSEDLVPDATTKRNKAELLHLNSNHSGQEQQ